MSRYCNYRALYILTFEQWCNSLTWTYSKLFHTILISEDSNLSKALLLSMRCYLGLQDYGFDTIMFIIMVNVVVMVTYSSESS